VADIEALQATPDISPHPSVTPARSLIYTDVTSGVDGTTKTIPGCFIPHSYIILTKRALSTVAPSLSRHQICCPLCFRDT
jgi:hypothetical protein